MVQLSARSGRVPGPVERSVRKASRAEEGVNGAAFFDLADALLPAP
jgi:hypothetical protein